MKWVDLAVFSIFVKNCLTLNNNDTYNVHSINWDQSPNISSYSGSAYLENFHHPENRWPEEDAYKSEPWEFEVTTDRYHVPAVMEGGLLRAQIPQHTLIAIDRFLRVLKSLAGFAILLAIGMPFIHEVTSSLFDETLKYIH